MTESSSAPPGDDAIVWRAPRPSVMLWRAVRRRCPRCGGKPVFTRWFHLVERCPRCGVRFRRDEAFFIGAFTVNLVITLTATFLVLMWIVLREAADQGSSLVPPLALAAVCVTVVPTVLYPISTLIWSALDLSSDPLDLTEIADAVDAVGAADEADDGAQMSDPPEDA